MVIVNILENCELEMQECVDKVANNFKKVRTGRMTSEMFDNVGCEYYGNFTPINQMASLQPSDPATLAIKPFWP